MRCVRVGCGGVSLFRQRRAAGPCGIVLDLRSDMPVEQRLPALREIHGAALRSGVKLPPVAGFEHQLATLVSRLTSERPSRPLWRGASGTVIMKDLFSASEARLHAGIGQLLWLFQYFALKTANESVNESMGGTVDMHAVGRRHLSQRAYEEEALIPSLERAPACVRAPTTASRTEHLLC